MIVFRWHFDRLGTNKKINTLCSVYAKYERQRCYPRVSTNAAPRSETPQDQHCQRAECCVSFVCLTLQSRVSHLHCSPLPTLPLWINVYMRACLCVCLCLCGVTCVCVCVSLSETTPSTYLKMCCQQRTPLHIFL